MRQVIFIVAFFYLTSCDSRLQDPGSESRDHDQLLNKQIDATSTMSISGQDRGVVIDLGLDEHRFEMETRNQRDAIFSADQGEDLDRGLDGEVSELSDTTPMEPINTAHTRQLS